MGEDPQKLKKMAAAAYDYENDPRWADYWSNVLVPAHMVSNSDVINHYKRKFYQRYIDPDLIVEPMSTSSSSQSTPPSATSSSRSSPSRNGQAYTQNSGTGSTNRTSGTSATAGSNPTPLRWERKTIHFSVNAWVFVIAMLAVIPLVPRSISQRAYRLSFLGTVCSSLFSLYLQYGKPRAWNLQALQIYLQSIVGTKDFIYLIYSISFVTSHLCLKFALIPILCQALEHIAKFLRRNFSQSTLYRKYMEEACVWVESNTTTLNILTSHAEIALGFLLIISLLSRQRNVLQTFMYWQVLKLMYQAPVTATYHRSVWAKIGRTVTPFIHRYAPALNTPLAAVQRWWFR
ncbi:hypothetical protein QN277_009188 [Acacia crassicarpa]|uniref:Transmembrane protein 33 homolog n=1 Tax=Acacia crassicarpa TaxID=499986 RepID=A0AAE1IUN4_9FABA|nr:hypothetical protein QN277_009188 [Acacia crassicarpa]